MTDKPLCINGDGRQARARGMCDPCYWAARDAGEITVNETGARETLIRELAGQGDWADRALCAETDPEAFFPEKGGSTREAKAVCRACEVRPECLAYALENREPFGIWGGLSERERRHLRRRVA